MKTLAKCETGSVAIYSAIVAVLGIGATAIAVDYGRMTFLKTQMQNRADAGALAAAVYLDGKDGARAKAQSVAEDTMTQSTAVASDGAEIEVAAVNFFSAISPTKVAATTDLDSVFIEVVVETKTVEFFFQPVLSMFAGGGSATSRQLNASAVAQPSPFICEAPPLMLCDPAEDDPSLALDLSANVGRQIRLKEPQAGSTPWVPGNFGLLALPDGSSGAVDIEGALAAVSPPNCYTLDVTTAPGSKTNKVKDGINARFDLPGGHPYPAPDVINYPRDDVIIADPNQYLGDGTWDLAAYWLAKHGNPVPVDLGAATRYQTYLYEQGLDYAQNGAETLYPVPNPLPAGYTVVTPSEPGIPVDAANSDDPDFDGVPSQAVASNGYARRLVKVAVLQCQAQSINGSGTYPTNGNYVEMFITEHVQDPPNAAIYGELVRTLTTTNSPEFHANVRLSQ